MTQPGRLTDTLYPVADRGEFNTKPNTGFELQRKLLLDKIFQTGRSTIDNISTLQEVCEHNTFNLQIHVIFIVSLKKRITSD